MDTMDVDRSIYYAGEVYKLDGRLMAKLPKNTGVEGLQGWVTCGGVYRVPNLDYVVNINQVLFVPWLLPPPEIAPDGRVAIELVAQIGKDLSLKVDKFDRAGRRGNYVGELSIVCIFRRKGKNKIKGQNYLVTRMQRFGEVYTTEFPQQLMLELTMMPFSVMYCESEHTARRFHTMFALRAVRPNRAIKRAKKQQRIEAAKKKRIMGGSDIPPMPELK